jgi:hypothetical protein
MDAQTIGGDVHCRSCGYNLRGLQTGGQCPECAADIAASLTPVEIFPDRAARNFTEIGLWLVVLAVGWQALFKASLILGSLDVISAVGPEAFNIANPALVMAVLLVQAFALFFFTARVRGQIRWMVFICLLIIVGIDVLISFGRPSTRWVNLFLESGLAVAFNALWLSHAAAIAEAAGNVALAERFLIFKWTLPLFLALGVVCLMLPRADWQVYGQIFCDGTAAVLSIWMIFLMLQLNGVLQKIHSPRDKAAENSRTISPELTRNGPLWIKWVGAGLIMFCIANSLSTLLAGTGFVLSWLIARSAVYHYSSSAFSPSDPTAAVIFRFLVWGARVVFIFWMTTSLPEESNPLKAEEFSRRGWLRFFALASAAAEIAVPFYQLHSISPSELVYWLEHLLDICESFCFFLYIEKDIAPLIDGEQIRRWAAALKWLVPLVGTFAAEVFYYLDIYDGLNRMRYSDLQTARRLITLSLDISVIWLLFTCWREFQRALRATAPMIAADVI